MKKYLSATLLLILFLLATPVRVGAATGTITGSSAYAWGENVGWLNFKSDSGNITISDSALTGYIWSPNYGWINLSPSTGGVTNTCGGVLGGYAWSATLGWIDFTGITIDLNGNFKGTLGEAGSTVGRITFDCSNCSVTTDWTPSCVATPTPTPAASPTPSPTTESSSSSSSSSDSSSSNSSSSDSSSGSSNTTTTNSLSNIISTVVRSRKWKTDQVKQALLIQLKLTQAIVVKASDLSVQISFKSSSSEPTPVDLTYNIFDSSGKLVWENKDNTIVETEEVLHKNFLDLQLAEGKYVFNLTTLYNGDIREEFKQSFTVVPDASQQRILILINALKKYAVLITVAVIFSCIIVLKIFKNKKMKIKIKIKKNK